MPSELTISEREEWRLIAKRHIGDESEAAHECAILYGRPLYSIKNTLWFEESMIDFLMGVV